MKGLFIVHGSKNIGMGHIMRTLPLATELLDRNCKICYFSKYEQGIQRLRRQGIDVIKMPAEEVSGWEFQYGQADELQFDLKFIKAAIGRDKPDIIVVDSYNVSREFFVGLKQLTKCLVYVDDLNLFPYPVDILVNGTVGAGHLNYTLENTQECLLLGTKYNLVRKEFVCSEEKNLNEIVRNVLITTGSADPCDMTGRFLEFLKSTYDFEQLNFHVIIGGGFKTENCQKWNMEGYDNIIFYENQENLIEIMKNCDLAISSGGSTLYELAALGIPCITFSYAENQVLQTTLLDEDKVLKNLGIYENIEKKEFLELFELVENDFYLRSELAENAQKLVDGLGSKRIADNILESVKVNRGR